MTEEWSEEEKIAIKKPVAPKKEAPKEGEATKEGEEAKGEAPAATPATEQDYEVKMRAKKTEDAIKFDTSAHAIQPKIRTQFR